MASSWKTLLPTASSTKRLIVNFADNAGLVYFGYVSQRSDEHHIVRGLTVSVKHHDDHYCIGTYDDYDVVFVERSDTLHNGKKHTWHIMEFDLRTTLDLPHVFIGSNTRTHGFHELLDIKFRSLQEIRLGHTAEYAESFRQHFSVHTAPDDALQIEQLLPPSIALTLASNFKGLAIEISENSLYVYSEQSHLTTTLLDTMLQNGSWLANVLDENSRQLT